MNLHCIIEVLLYVPLAASVLYTLPFAVAAKLRRQGSHGEDDTTEAGEAQPYFSIIIPAYAEDAVVQATVRRALAQDYPAERFEVVVVADHMTPATLQALHALPAKTLVADYADSTKAKALQLACRHLSGESQRVVVLDADNIVEHTFLRQLARECVHGDTALQCHRTAKNTDTPTALLDAASEEINNSIFRLGHNAMGLSSALIGSGMCFESEWFCSHVGALHTSGEDKELECMLLAERHHIRYLPHLLVYDEKVQSADRFGKQRQRWMAAQLATLSHMVQHMRWSVDYVDKTLQQALLPRSLCLLLTFVGAIVAGGWWWWTLLACLLLALGLALPRRMASRRLLAALATVPLLAARMMLGLLRLHGQNTRFEHTQHSA